MKHKFELFGGCFGNGILCCNRLVEENGDYKKVCHIGEDGKITWYVAQIYCPHEAIKTIEKWAQEKKEAHEKWFNGLSEAEKLEYIFDNMTISQLVEYLKKRKESRK